MSRLIAFGCSNTFGQGLPDCGEAPRYCGDNPSKLAWPNIAAQKLRLLPINLAQPGSSNKQITYSILNYQNWFEKSDTVVILWSFHARHTIFKKNDPVPDQFFLNQWEGQPHTCEFWRKYFIETYDQFNVELDNIFYMDYAHRFLLDKVKTVMHYVTDNFSIEMQAKYFSGDILGNGKELMNPYPRSLDNAHPGEQAHRAMATQIVKDYNRIQRR